MVLLYHYTDRAGKDGIYSDQLIRATDAGDGLGKVVRFTELPHFTDQSKLIANNWGRNAPPQSIAADKLRFWFKFDSSELPEPNWKVQDYKVRNVWACGADVPLKAATSQTTTTASASSSPATKTFYHYTNKAGKDAINRCGYIAPTKNWVMKSVVTLTDVEPTSDKQEIVYHVFGEKNLSQDLLDKVKYWFKFDQSELRDLQRVRNKKRRLWETPIAVYTKVVKSQHSGGPGQHSGVGSSSRHAAPNQTTLGKRGSSPPRSASQRQQFKQLSDPNQALTSHSQPAPAQYTPWFYYTDRAEKDAIFSSGKIEKQGAFVYLTETTPANSTTLTATLAFKGVLEYWFEFRDVDFPGAKKTTDPQGVTSWAVDHEVEIKLSTKQGRLATT